MSICIERLTEATMFLKNSGFVVFFIVVLFRCSLVIFTIAVSDLKQIPACTAFGRFIFGHYYCPKLKSSEIFCKNVLKTL